VRAVLDANVLIAAVLSPRGAPAEIVSRWVSGAFELVVSESLLSELTRSFAYPKLRRRVSSAEASTFIEFLRRGAVVASDPVNVPRRSADPGDDYLLALAESERAVLVTGDRHLLALAGELPVRTPRDFAARLSA
jgi:putative PIN family toxin of toxin-antitoxin system